MGSYDKEFKLLIFDLLSWLVLLFLFSVIHDSLNDIL